VRNLLHTLDQAGARICGPYLLQDIEVVVEPTPPYYGQYGDLPFQDPWWKDVLAALAIIFLIVAAVIAYVYGKNIRWYPGPTGGPTISGECCSNPNATTGIIASILAAIGAGIAGAGDDRDPFRRGQDNTNPAKDERTTAERLMLSLSYPEPVAPGRPYRVGADWHYTRITTGQTYAVNVREEKRNTHVLSRYEITAPNVVRRYAAESFRVLARFFDEGGQQLRADDLFVQCYLEGPHGQAEKFVLSDDGVLVDTIASDGTYTGELDFRLLREDPAGMWVYYVFAQDVNNADPDLAPEAAAQIIGGMLVTHQITISLQGGTCPMVPDGHVNVI
jgi:hypothetical protein